MPEEKLSPHFTRHEMLRSQTATRHGFTEQFDPTPEVIENLGHLCNNLLEKLRVLNGNKAIFITSGYRCLRTNKAVGSKNTSQHIRGQAADIDFGSRALNKAFFLLIKNSGLEFDQLLNEFDYDWVHVSLKKTGNRKDVKNINK